MIKKFLMYVWEVFAGILQGILNLFGFSPRGPSAQHENLGREDVEAAAAEARSAAAAADVLDMLRGPEGVVHEYAMSPSDQRAKIDLSPLSPEEQDWLLGLSDGDLAMLAASSADACRKSLAEKKVVVNVRRLRERQEVDAKNPAPLLEVPDHESEDKWRHISDVIRGQYPSLFGDCGGGGPALKPRCRA